MIKAKEAICIARGLIGTAYSEMDCINLIKKVIRTAPGGEKRYTTAGTNDLWNSDSKSAKYRDLTWKQAGISGAKPGMLAFMGAETGDVNHVGLVTERGTVLHSSKSRGQVVETELTKKAGWDGLGIHRLIEVEETENQAENQAEGGESMAYGNATAKTQTAGSYVNLREGASTRAKVIGRVDDGTRVNITREAGSGWVFVKLEGGEAGYMSADYLVEDGLTADDSNAESEKSETGAEKDGSDIYTENVEVSTTTLRRSDGVYITLAGKWTLAED